MRSAPCAWTCHRANDAARDCARAGSRALHGLPSSKRCDRYRRPSRTCARAVELTRQEEAANARRWQESGRQGGLDEWSWSLNWDAVRDDVIVGSCPRSADDIVRFFRFKTIHEQTGADAILCLQSRDCFEHLGIARGALEDAAVDLEVIMAHIEVRDFDRGDQAQILGEAVRQLGVLLALGKRVYVHCTAGINRANLVVVAYLTNVEEWDLNRAETHVKSKRRQAQPYIDAWTTSRERLLHGRDDDVKRAARVVHDECAERGEPAEDHFANWVAAEARILSQDAKRLTAAELYLLRSVRAVHDLQLKRALAQDLADSLDTGDEAEESAAVGGVEVAEAIPAVEPAVAPPAMRDTRAEAAQAEGNAADMVASPDERLFMSAPGDTAAVAQPITKAPETSATHLAGAPAQQRETLQGAAASGVQRSRAASAAERPQRDAAGPTDAGESAAQTPGQDAAPGSLPAMPEGLRRSQQAPQRTPPFRPVVTHVADAPAPTRGRGDAPPPPVVTYVRNGVRSGAPYRDGGAAAASSVARLPPLDQQTAKVSRGSLSASSKEEAAAVLFQREAASRNGASGTVPRDTGGTKATLPVYLDPVLDEEAVRRLDDRLGGNGVAATAAPAAPHTQTWRQAVRTQSSTQNGQAAPAEVPTPPATERAPRVPAAQYVHNGAAAPAVNPVASPATDERTHAAPPPPLASGSGASVLDPNKVKAPGRLAVDAVETPDDFQAEAAQQGWLPPHEAQAMQDELRHVKQLLKGHQELGRMVQRRLDGAPGPTRR